MTTVTNRPQDYVLNEFVWRTSIFLVRYFWVENSSGDL